MTILLLLAPIVALGFIAVLQNVDVIMIRHQVGEDAQFVTQRVTMSAKP